jgi:hypothetical protein
MCEVFSQPTVQLWLVWVLTMVICFALHKTFHWKVALVQAIPQPSTLEEMRGRIQPIALPTSLWL